VQESQPPAAVDHAARDSVIRETGRPPPAKRFGTFIGVYTPSVLTILGVMMYLRFGWVVGNVGLVLALVIVLAASTITCITALSASSVATNMRVGAGGEYFMVSRSLGLELGGAIGIPLFLCRTLSLTLYAFGLAESFAFLWPASWGEVPLQGLAAVIIIATTAIAGKSADASLKLQIPIMIAVGLSVMALTGGVATGGFTAPELSPHYERSAPEGFWYVFAVFFPAVTGFTAGIGMSGDLEDPQRSIPRGTMLAVATGTGVYLFIVLLLGITAKVTPEQLAVLDPNAPPIWSDIAWFGAWLVFPGMWGAILSSAFGSALGGPRVLQALAADGLAPRLLARSSRTGQPTIATWVTGGIALAAVALGNLNAVGRWVTIFFLTLYVTINLAAGLERLSGDVSFRPTLKIPWWVSLIGSLGALLVMFLINRWACLAAIGVELLIYLNLRRRAMESAAGDVRAGAWTALARYALLQLRELGQKARNWRPHIMLFTANPESRMGLVRLANWFNQNRGVVTVCQLVTGQLGEDEIGIEQRLQSMDKRFRDEGVVAFSEVTVVPEFVSGVLTVAQANGIAGLQSNTLMFGWPNDVAGVAALLGITRAVARIDKSVILARLPHDEGPPLRNRIDVWWRGRAHNGDMMLLLAHLLNQNPEWRRATVTVRSVVTEEEERDAMQRRLEQMVNEVRIGAETSVIVKPPDQTFREIMHEASRHSDVVFLGLPLVEAGDEASYAERLQELASGFAAAIFVRNSGPFRGQLL
jgi:amino acid transporter